MSGVLDSVKSHLRELTKDSASLTAAMKVIPKGVIIWTSPYKQLYKNPGLLVSASADGMSLQLDQLAVVTQAQAELAEVKERVQEAINDAEGKYASLWKLYVFLSDGLFYTGVYAKLVEHECSKDPYENPEDHPHKNHLEAAERLLISAFRIAFQWSIEHKAIMDLGKTMSVEDFKNLLEQLTAHHDPKLRLEPNFHDGISAVMVEWYIHGADTHRCRDTRYKFDTAVATDGKAGDCCRQHVVEMLSSLDCPLSKFKNEELNEIVLRYRRTIGDAKWPRGTDFKELWRDGLPTVVPSPAPIQQKGSSRSRVGEFGGRRAVSGPI